MIADWLLVIDVAGRTLRYATQARVVAGAVYRPGLIGELALPEGLDSVVVAVVARDLHELADDLDSATATLSLLEGDEVTVYAAGQVADPDSGASDEPVTFRIVVDIPGVSLGTSVPGPTARVDATTWPVTAGHSIGSAGLEYPVIFGFPGWTGSGNAICVVPAPLAQWQAATTATSYVVVSEDPDADVASVRVRNQASLNETVQNTLNVSDLLGQRIKVANFAAGNLPSDPSHVLLLGYAPLTGGAAGGGVARSLYDVVRYVLRRWAPESVDWARLPQIRPALEPYNVDSWVSATIADPWVLIEALIRDLGVEIRIGERGRYLVARRYSSDPSRVVGSITVGSDALRRSTYTRTGEPRNEIAVRYRSNPESGWLATVIACGSRREVQPAGVSLGASVLETAPARRSYARYGRRVAPGLDLDWTWDTGTALAVASRILDEVALPATLVEYQVRPSSIRGVREGDELLVTDPDRPWVAQAAIVDAPPLRSLDAAIVRLRVPQ